MIAPAPAAVTQPQSEPPAAAVARAGGAQRVLLLGNPNTGKTTLFNRLCGLRAKTANFPGTTAEVRSGRLFLPYGEGAPETVELLDLPGVYSLDSDLPEARTARLAFDGARAGEASVAVVVTDATNVLRNLGLVGELLRRRVRVVLALNMIDLARRRGLSFDLDRMTRFFGAPVVAVAARSGEGLGVLLARLRETLERPPRQAEMPPPESGSLDDWADEVVAASVGGRQALGAAGDTLIDRLDAAFTHPVLGLVTFLAVMAGLFWTLFALATVPMDLIEATFASLGGLIERTLPAGAVRDLLVGGLLGGLSGTVVFLPQIGLLFFLITLLEDTGYLARAAFVMDRLLCRFGLPGHAFVPLLSSHACAIPGILSTRLIPNRRDRLATILVAPFMSCSARLPVYVLLTTFLFPTRPLFAGLAFTGCFVLGSIATLGSAMLARRSILPGKPRPMILELPSYKWPSLRVAFATALEQGWSFLRTVGTVILAICFVMWWLSAYPKAAPPEQALALESRAAVAVSAGEAAALRAEAGLLTARHQQEASFAGRLGRLAQPLFAPLGYDWRLSMGVLTSFAAREVMVSTLAVLSGAENSQAGVLERIHRAKRDDGTPLLTPAVAVSLLVFFVLAMQCLSTVVTVRRETRGWKWPAVQFAWMTGMAWIAAWIAFHGLRAAGVA